MWLTILSDQLPVVGLVGRYLTNYLIGREPLPAPLACSLQKRCLFWILARITRDFSQLSGM
jgi:hypothetical protein